MALAELQKEVQELLRRPEALVFEPPLDNGQLGSIKEVLRTPDECFDGLPDFPFQPHYFESRVHGRIRMHYIDEGPRDAKETIFLLHGEPCWCFVFRHMIPPLAEAGFRVVAPDMVGFGRSDKPARRTDHSYERHVDWVSELVVGLGLDNVTCFYQDWGGLVGLRVVARLPERFLRVAIANTALLTGAGVKPDFKAWAGVISQRLPEWGEFVDAMCARQLTKAEQQAYDAPFPAEAFRVASRELPRLVPQLPDHPTVEENKGAWRRVFWRWRKPFLTLFSEQEGASKEGGSAPWQDGVPGAQGQKHCVIQGASHYIQEDKPLELVERILQLVRDNPLPLNMPTVITKL